MASRRSWGDFQAACRFDSGTVGHLVVLSIEESHPLNRESSPRDCIFHSAFFSHLYFPFASLFIFICDRGSLSRASVSGILVTRATVSRPSFQLQACARYVLYFYLFILSFLFLQFLLACWVFCLRLRVRGNVQGFSGGFDFVLGPLWLLLPSYCLCG